QGRYDEAERLVAECEAASGPNDIHSQIAARTIRARILAHRGELEAAESFARDAVDFGAASDFLIGHAEAYEGLAEVLEVSGRRQDAAKALQEALNLYEQKGNLLASDDVRARLASFGA